MENILLKKHKELKKMMIIMLKEGKIIEELDINGKLHLFIVSFFEMDYILNYLIYAFIYIFI